MKKQLECRTLCLEDKELVESLAAFSCGDWKDPEDIFLLWKSSFREESLNHYLNMNWCFGCFSGGALVGVILLQPMLFFNGLTQVLWVESLKALDVEVEKVLLEVSYKTAREKHLQTMVFSEQREWQDLLNLIGLKAEVGKHSLMVKTAFWS